MIRDAQLILCRQRHRFAALLVGIGPLVVSLAANHAQADEITFTVDSTATYLTLTGDFQGFSFEPQGLGSDTAHYSGEIVVDVDDPLAPEEIQFLSGLMLAEVTGEWRPAEGGGDVGDENIQGDANPGDPAPGNYGVYLDAGALGEAWGAFRNLGFTITSELQSVDNGQFEEFQTITAAQGFWDTNLSSVALNDSAGTDDVTGDNAMNDEVGTYTVDGNVARLELPITSVFLGSAEFTFEGLLLATAFVGPAIPGDFNEDQVLDVQDIDALTEVVILSTNEKKYDLNADDLVNQQDRQIWVKDLRKTWFGDADLNLEFNSSDMVQVFVAGKYETGEAAGWAQGDWNGNGVFDSGDMVVAFVDGGYEQGQRVEAVAVPEPGVWTLWVMGLLLGYLPARRMSSADC